jgi:hypothetical protein
MSTETTEQKAPTKEQVIKFYEEQIEIARLRRDLSALLAETAKYDAERAEAVAKQAHFSAPRPQQPAPMIAKIQIIISPAIQSHS